MATIINVRNQLSNPDTGFSISKPENIDRLFPNGISSSTTFHIGNLTLHVLEISSVLFFMSGHTMDTIDEKNVTADTVIIVRCESPDYELDVDFFDFAKIAKQILS